MKYVQRIALSFSVLAMLALTQGALGWLILREADHRLQRGRLASDLYSTWYQFESTQQALRIWVLQQTRDRDVGQHLLARLTTLIDQADRKVTEALRLDLARGKSLEGYRSRQEAIAYLRAAITDLDRATATLMAAPTAQALDRTEALLQGAGGRDLPQFLAAILAAEAEALAQERQIADQALAQLNVLLFSAGGTGLVACIGLAVMLALRLRQPLRALNQGLDHYRQGDLTYPFPALGDQEFQLIADHLGQMTTEISVRRHQETQFRTSLETAITARTAELATTLSELAAAEQARRQLLRDISHELRTPITVIRGEAQVTLRGGIQSSEVYCASLERIAAAATQMGYIVNDLVVLAQEQAKEPACEWQTVDITATLLPQVLSAAETLAQPRGISLMHQWPPGPILITLDPQRMAQVLLILLDNAIRYSYAKGTVHLDVRSEAETVRICIRDAGIGIQPQEVAHVFERGWRSQQAQQHHKDGSGLGLAIASRFVAQHGGELCLTPNPSGGTLASLTLPRQPTERISTS